MAYSVRVDLHQAAIRNFLYSPAGPIVRGVGRWAEQVRVAAIANAPKDTGALASSSIIEMSTRPGFVVAEIGFMARHAMWVHEGTGIYGPRRRPIRSRRKKMRFPNRGGGSRGGRPSPFVYVSSVRGQPGQPFLVYALYLVMLTKGARIRTFRR